MIWRSWKFLIHAGSSELLESDQYHENFKFLIVDNRETHITGKLKPLIWTTNVICKSYLVARTHVKIKDHKWQYCIGGEICLFYITSCPWNPPGWRRLSKDPPTSRSHAASVTLQSYIRARGASNSTTSPVTTSLSPLVRQAARVEVASHFRIFLPHEISSRKVCASLSWFTAINI